ncbi:hypothetical protein HY483_00915 [Candidatus Woesearchaeota archaeon]|nr:hypothetical protein [Candidatus Woesearchaeota archaeon]
MSKSLARIVLSASIIFCSSGCNAFRSGLVQEPAIISQISRERHLEVIKERYTSDSCSDVESILNLTKEEFDPTYHFYNGLRDSLSKIYFLEDNDFSGGYSEHSYAAHAHIDTGISLPHHGCLNAYSGSSLAEDVATFTSSVASSEYRSPDEIIWSIQLSNCEAVDSECPWNEQRKITEKERMNKIKKSLPSLVNALTIIFPLYFCDSSDVRFKQKIDLLRRYDFISEEQHEFMTARVGSLRYLLDEN